MPDTPFRISTSDGEAYGRFYDAHGMARGERRMTGPFEGEGHDKLFQNALVPAAPVDVMAKIKEIIAGDVANGYGERVAMICIDPILAVHLRIDGRLTPEHGDEATVHGDFISFPRFEIDGRTLELRVYSNPPHQLYTADASGEIIP